MGERRTSSVSGRYAEFELALMRLGKDWRRVEE